MSGRNEVKADLQNSDSKGGIDKKGIETIYQRDPLPNMSEHNEVETELADHKKMAQKDVEVKKDQVRTDNQENLQNEDDTEIETGAMREAQAPVNNAQPIWIYIIGCGVLALVTPFALSAGRSSATSFVASSMMPMAFIDNAADMVVNGGRLIPWNMMAATANLAGTAGANLAGAAGIGIFNNAMNFASNGIITPKLG